MKVKGESEKAGLKINIQKRKIWHLVRSLHGKQKGKKMEIVTKFIFLGSKITADKDCSHEIKRCLLLGRKAMKYLDSILKSRSITLPTKVHLVKAMVFPVVMYGCQSWTIKEAECQRIDAFDCIKLDCKEIKPVNPKGSQSSIFIGRIDAEAPILWPMVQRADSLEKTLMLGKIEGRRRRGQRTRLLDDITDSMDMSLSKLQEMMKDRGACCAAVHVVAKSRIWQWLNNKMNSRMKRFTGQSLAVTHM